MLSFTDLAKKGVPLHVTLQARGERRYESDSSNTRAEMREAGFKKEMIEANVRGLRKVVAKLDWKPGGSEWAGYADEHEHVGLQREAKGEFLSQYRELFSAVRRLHGRSCVGALGPGASDWTGNNKTSPLRGL